MDYWEKANHSWSADSSRVILTPSQKSKELFYYIQEIGHFKAKKPYFTERANLPSYLVKFTLSGQGQLTYHGQEQPIEAGDVFFIDCKEYQLYKTTSESPWEMDWVHFYGGNAALFYQEFVKDGRNVFHTLQDPQKNRLHQLITEMIHLQTAANARTDF